MTIQDSKRGAVPGAAAAPAEVPDLGAIFDGHIAREFADLDVDATMETMVAEPYVYCIPVMTGGLRWPGRPPLLQ